MKGNKKHIDEIFKDGLQNLEFTNAGNVWERVEASMEPKKKRRFGFWLWAFTGILTGLAVVLLIFWLSGMNDLPQSDKEITSKAGNQITGITDQQNDEDSREHAFDSASSSDQKSLSYGSATDEIKDDDKEVYSGKGHLSNDEPQKLIDLDEASFDDQNMFNKLPSSTSVKSLAKNYTANEKKVAGPDQKDQSILNQVKIADTSGQSTDDLSNRIGKNMNDSTKKVKQVDTLSDSLQLSEDKNQLEPKPLVNRPVISFGLVGGTLRPNQRLKNMQGFSEYSSIKSGNEIPDYGLSYGVNFDIGWKLPQKTARFTLSSGLMKTNIRYKTPTIHFIQRDSFPFLDPDGDTIAMIPKSPIDSFLTNQGNLKYHAYAIPIEIGYAIGIAKRLEVEGTVGVSLNIITSISGRTIDSRLELKNGEDLNYRKYNLGFTSSLGLNYAAGKNIKFSLAMNYTQLAPNLYRDDASGNVRISTYGFTTGVYYEFIR